MTDPITDMLNRIRNAQLVHKPVVQLPFSRVKYALGKILEEKGFVSHVESKGRKHQKEIKIVLKYDKDKEPGLAGAKRVSKPGQRMYGGYRRMRYVKGGYGIAIVSTSKGLMTDADARKAKLGGEIIAEVW